MRSPGLRRTTAFCTRREAARRGRKPLAPDFPKARLANLGIEGDEHGFSVTGLATAHAAVIGIRDRTAGITNRGGIDARQLPEQALRAPEAVQGEPALHEAGRERGPYRVAVDEMARRARILPHCSCGCRLPIEQPDCLFAKKVLWVTPTPHNRIEPPATLPRPYGVRVSLRANDPLARLCGADWQRVHWYDTAAERDAALAEISRKHEYPRPGDRRCAH